jgi:hypothetical protein
MNNEQGVEVNSNIEYRNSKGFLVKFGFGAFIFVFQL